MKSCVRQYCENNPHFIATIDTSSYSFCTNKRKNKGTPEIVLNSLKGGYKILEAKSITQIILFLTVDQNYCVLIAKLLGKNGMKFEKMAIL